MTFPNPPENIITSLVPGGCKVSTIRYNTGAYETLIFDSNENVIGLDKRYDSTLSDALRNHVDAIELLCGGDLDAKRNTVKVEVSD